MQLELPIPDIDSVEDSSPKAVPNSVQQVLPNGYRWYLGNQLIPGLPFAIWATPNRDDDFNDCELAAKKTFDTYRASLNSWPWSLPMFHFDQQTGTSVITATTFSSPQE